MDSSFTEIMHTYFRGERLEAWLFIVPSALGLLALAVAAYRTETGGFSLGVAIPAALFGLVLLATGVAVGARTPAQVAALEQGFAEQPAETVAEELPRMKKVNANFRTTFIVFGVVAALGLALHYFGGPNWGRGLGAVLILGGAIGLLIDAFAERRAVPYTKALERLAAGQGPPAE